jgi:3-hydroxypropanoate dehydrogenase
MTLLETTQLPALDESGRALLFTEARTANTFSDEPVSDAELTDIWQLARWAPTSANIQPLRVVYVRTPEGKERLLRHMSEGNQAKVRQAPVSAILATDLDFHEQTPKTFPHRPELQAAFAADPARREEAARFNAVLQAGYFILAVRAAGLAAGPMLGFDGAGIDAEFFAGTPLRTILVVNIGHPGDNPWFERLPRLDEDDVLTFA